MLLLIFVLYFHIFMIQAATLTPPGVKCSDGKLPLLDENHTVFECKRGCPTNFYCEQQTSSSLCCPNATALLAAAEITVETTILRGKKDVEFQLESSAELENSLSCERYPYRTSCDSPTDNQIGNSNSTVVQPIAKWYFDVATLSCEMYPLGMCLENDPLEKLALKSKLECEERCDVAKVKEVLGRLKSEENTVEGPHVYHFNRFPNHNVPQIAIDDVAQESKHLLPRGRPFAIEPPTDLFHVIHVKLDKIPREDPEDVTLLTTSEADTDSEDFIVSTVTSDILNVFEEPINDDGDILEGSGILTKSEKFSGNLENLENSGKITITVTEEGEESEESAEKQTERNSVQDERQQRKKTVESMEASFERFYQRNKESVVCSQSSYRLICPRGTPSQFVYRWEKVNGECLSFPYGYCLKELNIAHPRTREECEQFCD